MAPSAESVLLIANPAAQNGKGARAAKEAAAILRVHLGDERVVAVNTAGPRHACELAERAMGCSTVIALGGDGVIHEVAGGLLRRPAHLRPTLGVIPVGSGNDYARSLGVSRNLSTACQQFLEGSVQLVDVGRVNDEWFLETLSFGLDAAIAHDTMERRKRTGRTGILLYAESGVNQLINQLNTYHYTASFDGGVAVSSSSIMFAVQLGPYYGSGFKICPQAEVNDGIFDVCIAHPPVSAPRALYIFARAMKGEHTGFKQIEMRRCRRIHIEFETEPPAQVDGEMLTGRLFDIEILPQELSVVVPPPLAL